ncbi:hypothetical protein HanXRQr2_Chr14g0643611 [Helianthus annuus]|uniref:Uncharacterized protein n=1 Tax=Helianthus annuus TaxID=4232 RepID=A0A9K3H8G0_HELAN|nr:hypothetical protein HanXRQr2_Chr14g0643611 [Helianthus annuus]KAJ0840336.1 hypothetical protein HanPSC8_Chr14g0617481 [Helianthus annuus]
MADIRKQYYHIGLGHWSSNSQVSKQNHVVFSIYLFIFLENKDVSFLWIISNFNKDNRVGYWRT